MEAYQPNLEVADQLITRCLVCGGTNLMTLLTVPPAPAMYHATLRSRDVAIRQVLGRITLAHCATCDYIFNQSLDPSLISYSQGYDNAQHHSATFTRYLTNLSSEILKTFNIHHETIIEIGCGQGSFLNIICHLGENRGFGFDPGFNSQNSSMIDPLVQISSHDYDASYLGRGRLVCARHVLEHISTPVAFTKKMIELMSPEVGIMFFEVPNGAYIWNGGSPWDILYEHVSYFSRNALGNLLRTCGLEVICINERFGGQFLTAVARRSQPSRRPDGAHVENHDLSSYGPFKKFVESFQGIIKSWREWLGRARGQGRQIYVWGGGTKAISFLNFVIGARLDLQPVISGVIDINPEKEGRFIPGTGHQILGPRSLVGRRPHAILLMNPMYEGEVRQTLSDIFDEDANRVEIVIATGLAPA